MTPERKRSIVQLAAAIALLVSGAANAVLLVGARADARAAESLRLQVARSADRVAELAEEARLLAGRVSEQETALAKSRDLDRRQREAIQRLAANVARREAADAPHRLWLRALLREGLAPVGAAVQILAPAARRQQGRAEQ